MSGRIKILDSSGVPFVIDDVPALGYEYDEPGEFDRLCGSFGLDPWQLPNEFCPKHFVCSIYELRNDGRYDNERSK